MRVDDGVGGNYTTLGDGGEGGEGREEFQKWKKDHTLPFPSLPFPSLPLSSCTTPMSLAFLTAGRRLTLASTHRAFLSSSTKTASLQQHRHIFGIVSFHGLRSTSFLTNTLRRELSTQADNEPPTGKESQEEASEVSTEVLTPGEKVKAGGSLVFQLGLAGLAVVCSYFIGVELFGNPFGMTSPNSLMDKSFERAKSDPAVRRVFGEDLKVRGKGGRRSFWVTGTNCS